MEGVNHLLIGNPISKKTKFIVVFIILLVIARLILPSVVKHYLNDYLANDIENYVGHVNDVDLAIYRGAYQLQDLELKKKLANKKNEPFVDIKEIDISLSWKALFRGKFLIDLRLTEPKITFMDSKKKDDKQLGTEPGLKDVLDNVVPFNIENLVVNKGGLFFLNKELKVPIKLSLDEIELKAEDIHNSKKEKKTLVSKYELTAKAQNHSHLKSNGSFNILVEPIAFDVNLKLEKLKLTELNEFIKVYGPLDLTSGELNFYMEAASKKNKLTGYLKPMFKNMDVRAGSKERDDSFKEFGFEIITAVVNVILKNSDTKSLASKIPLEGSLDDPKFDMWEGIKVAVSNGFGKPDVKAKIDNEVNLKSVDKKKK